MLLIVLFLCVATSSFVAFKRRDQLSIYLLGMSLSNLLMLTGVIIYIAAMGGIAATEQVFLFLRPEVKTWFQYLPISMSMLGYLVTVGRTLFPYFLLLLRCSVPLASADTGISFPAALRTVPYPENSSGFLPLTMALDLSSQSLVLSAVCP